MEVMLSSRNHADSRTMTKSLDADLFRDLRGLDRPPSFDGNDAEYQDLRFRFRIRMSFVSAVSNTLMDRCEFERKPSSVAAVQALGDAHMKCCIQMYFSLALITKGRVRIDNTPLMQKIMMLAKLWCDHAEGFESGLRVWELHVGEGERASGTALAADF